ncbi:MAG: glycosyltransferase family 2 protein [Thermoanaerobaculia bacterium]|nr:glycosyltransferase family 2 protein [Thermoanaerobaculia bacterium]
MQPTVHILLSTFDGERFLTPQLESLVAQDYPACVVHVRDDGSGDDTPRILDEFADRHPKVVVETGGGRRGFVGSFLELLRLAPDGPGHLYAFCDQDDVWRPDKISRAVAAIGAGETADTALYFARVEVVDADLQPLTLSPLPRRPGFANAVVENVVTGCTAVLGRRLRELMLEAPPESMLLHDWWAYLVGSAFGRLCYDPVPAVKHRQHGANVSQWEGRAWKRAGQRAGLFARRFRSGEVGFSSLRQAESFLEVYGDRLGGDERALVEELVALRSAGPLARLGYALRPKVRRSRRFDDLVMRVLIVLGQH